MNKQGRHDEDIALVGGDRHGGRSARQPVDLITRQATVTMRAWHHAKRAVVLGTVVEVETKGDDAFENIGGRLDVDDTRFYAPRSESRRVDPFADANRQVLVPWDLPIRFGDFIEEGCFYGPG